MNGYIYQACVLEINKGRNNYHNFIGLSDFHDKIHPYTLTQCNEIQHLLSVCSKENTKIILEDLSSEGSQGRFACGRFFINSRGGILGGLAKQCADQKFTVDNVEYRYCRVSSLGPVLNNLSTSMDAFPSTTEISVTQLVQEIKDIIKEIRSYKDGKQLTAYYKKYIQEVTQELKNLDLAGSSSVAHYLETHSTPATRLDLLKKLLTFDSNLLDLKLVHSIVSAPQTTVIALAGGSHISRAREILEKDGYQVVYNVKVDYGREENLTQCLGSHIIDGKYCMRPVPIPLGGLCKYLK